MIDPHFSRNIKYIYTVKVSFLARDRERDRELVFCLTFHHDHFGLFKEKTWGRYGTLTITRQEQTLHCIDVFCMLYNLGLVDRFHKPVPKPFFNKPVQFSNRFIGTGSIFEPVY
jgi:hypothetical protein